MAKALPKILGIMTYRLSKELSRPIYSEYESRYKDIEYLLQHNKSFWKIKKDIKTIEILLAMSIYYKRVIANLHGACNFHKTVHSTSNANVIEIGNYRFDRAENNKMLHIVLAFKAIQTKYRIMDFVFEYNETKGFLDNVVRLKEIFSRK